MTLPVSPNSISLSQVNTELGLTSTATISLNDAAVRALFSKSSGIISMSDGWGKSSVATPTLAAPAFTSAVGGVNQVSFTWTAVADATSYDVTFNGVTTNQAGTSFTKSSVSAGDYQCAVSAKASGYNNSSTTVSGVVTVTASAVITPSTPTYNISLKTANNYRITLSSTNANYYYLYETTGGGFEDIGYTSDGIFNISGKAPSTTQTYQAYATNGTNSGNVNFSVTTLPDTVTLTTSAIESTTARITATINSGGAPTNFHLFRNINGTNTFIRSAVNGIFDLYDMDPGTTYGPYRSYAENAAGISAYWSNDVYVDTTA
jgi:hypothetical protein